jgi:hypothetical protein
MPRHISTTISAITVQLHHLQLLLTLLNQRVRGTRHTKTQCQALYLTTLLSMRRSPDMLFHFHPELTPHWSQIRHQSARLVHMHHLHGSYPNHHHRTLATLHPQTSEGKPADACLPPTTRTIPGTSPTAAALVPAANTPIGV